jgi:dTDP-D-glucose 4,6-dehydratase
MRRRGIWPEGLRATIDWYLANTRWWQALLGRDYADWLEKNYSR